MDIEAYRDHCLSKRGVTESTPFPRLPEVLVFKVMGKMFTATDMTTFNSISVKCHPDRVAELREKYAAVQPPSYLSHKHWNRVIIDGSIPDQEIFEWIDTSYQLVATKLPKKMKQALKNS